MYSVMAVTCIYSISQEAVKDKNESIGQQEKQNIAAMSSL
jgi:hypothetical protein